MQEQRRHRRIRFNTLPLVRIGAAGVSGQGELENLSLGGLMLRTDLSFKLGDVFACEFTLFDSPLLEISAVVMSKIGSLYGVRFESGPIGEWLLDDAITIALATGKASVLSMNDLQGRKVMRVLGGLNKGLRNDFMHNLGKFKVDELDLSGVTQLDTDGVALCRIAFDQYQVKIEQASVCVRAVLAGKFGV